MQMIRTILSSVGMAVLLSWVASPQAAGQDSDFQNWQKNLGPPSGSSKGTGGWPSKYEGIQSGKETDAAVKPRPGKKMLKPRKPAAKRKAD